MNFVQPGGEGVAMVAVPAKTYRGTDFTTAFFHVNVNRSLSEQECSEFAIVDARNPDGEPMDAEKLQVGTVTMEKTSNFSGDALKQAETQYYHRYESGACYEFVLGLGTAGFGTDGNVEAVNHDEVFANLEKILATVKIQPVEKRRSQSGRQRRRQPARPSKRRSSSAGHAPTLEPRVNARGLLLFAADPQHPGPRSSIIIGRMNTPQSGIFALGTASHAYLEFDACAGQNPRDLVAAISSLRERGRPWVE